MILFSLAGLLVVGSVAVRPSTRPIRTLHALMISLSIVALFAAWTTIRTTPDPDRLDRVVGASHESGTLPIRIQGQIISRVSTQRRAQTPADPPRLRPVYRSMRLRVHAVESNTDWIPATGVLTVVLPDDSDRAYQAGKIATVLGGFRSPGVASNPGDPDWNARSVQNNRVGSIYVDHDELITIDHPETLARRLGAVFYNARAHARSRAIDALALESENTKTQGVMGALILGQRDARFDDVYRSFQRIGIAHMLAISGFHVAVMIGLAVLLVRLVGDYPRIETLVVCAIAGAILVLLPLRPPILRALLLVVVLLGAGGAGRRYDRLTVLVWIAIALLIYRPLDLFSLGYQLSVGVTALLLALPTRVSNEVPTTKHAARSRAFARIVWNAVQTNAACWIVATPAIMLHAGVLTLIAPITTILMLPLIVLMMIVGYAQLMLGILFPSLADAVRTPISSVANWTTNITLAIDSIPGSSMRAPNLGSLWTIAATVVFASLILRPKLRSARFSIPAISALTIWGAVVLSLQSSAHHLRIDMIDVGNGSSILIRSEEQAALFDSGSLDRPIDQTIARAAHELCARPVQIAFVSHDNLDHFNALVNAPIDLGLRIVYVTAALEHAPSQAWIAVRQRLIDQAVEIRTIHAGESIPFAHSTIDVIWPPKDLDPATSENNSSLVLLISTQTRTDQRAILLCGDIESETMNAIMRTHPDLRADIIEAPHHGSPNPELLELIDQLRSRVILQSTGRSRLNDPRLAGVREQTNWMSTADQGAIYAEIHADGSVTHGSFHEKK